MTISKLLYHPITIITITVVAIVFFFSLDKSSQKMKSSAENIRILEHEVSQVSNEVIALEEKIAKTTSLQFQEKVVRNELLLQKEGEIILQIPDKPEENDENNCEDNCTDAAVKSPISAWKDLLL